MALTVASHLDDLLASFALDPRMVHLEHLPARPARFADLAVPLADELRDRLPFDRFWTHQAAAIDLARAGHSVAIATGTASGKSLCYQVPIAEAVGSPVRPATSSPQSSDASRPGSPMVADEKMKVGLEP